jgi:hypothetical protein
MTARWTRSALLSAIGLNSGSVQGKIANGIIDKVLWCEEVLRDLADTAATRPLSEHQQMLLKRNTAERERYLGLLGLENTPPPAAGGAQSFSKPPLARPTLGGQNLGGQQR